MSQERKFFLEEETQKQLTLDYLYASLDKREIASIRGLIQQATFAIFEYNQVARRVHMLDGRRDFIPEGGLDLLTYLLSRKPEKGIHLISHFVRITTPEGFVNDEDLLYFTERGVDGFDSVINPSDGLQSVGSIHYSYPLDYGRKYQMVDFAVASSEGNILDDTFGHITRSLGSGGLYIGTETQWGTSAKESGIQTMIVNQNGFVEIDRDIGLSSVDLSLRDIVLLCRDGVNSN